MAEQVLVQIQEVESQARVIIERARGTAAKLVADTQDEMIDTMIKFTELCERQATEQKIQREMEIQANSIKYSEDTIEQCIAIKSKLLLRKAEAVAALLHMITA